MKKETRKRIASKLKTSRKKEIAKTEMEINEGEEKKSLKN